jgi:thiol-disulfide isomerase/thioredoxin
MYTDRGWWRPWLTGAGALVCAALVVVLVMLWQPAPAPLSIAAAQDKDSGDAAPDFDGGTGWYNAAAPIKMKDLKGKVVLLDFWTLCCINCIHTLPDLAKLEKKYEKELVVIGVHSPKFENEKDGESIRKAILRYQISHPVVNDSKTKIWRSYGVRSWPTLCLIDPEGKIVGIASGEGNYDVLDKAIEKVIAKHKEKGTLKDKEAFKGIVLEKEKQKQPLYFPGKVVADAKSNRLFIADSTHHRIVITDLAGKKIAIAGTGEVGKADGAFDKASFNDPQGMALRDDILYVADRKNHMIRALDLKSKTVKTVAGTGEQFRSRNFGGPGLKTGLNSPWDLWLKDNQLFVAMAGHHQIWTFNVKKGDIRSYAGDGREDIVDGELDVCRLAQPSGLASDGANLYVADSEASAIRSINLDGKGECKTLVGVEGDGLFNYGDKDGVGSEVRLQHALGVTYWDGKVYVADTYNSKIKEIDPKKRSCNAFKGNKEQGWVEEREFFEPGGISAADGKLYIADTNAHRIRVIDLKTKFLSNLTLSGVEAPVAK